MTQTRAPLRAADMRIHNQKIILSKIYEAGNKGVSQSELVVGTGLRAPTLFRIFSSLEEQGLIEAMETSDDAEEDIARRGRRPMVYATRKDALYAIGLEFWVSYISIGIFDFRGNRIFSRVEPLRKDIDIAETLDCIVKLVREALSSFTIPAEKISGIGVAAPGQVDISRRLVLNYGRIEGMNDYPLAEKLEERLGIPAILHNNTSVIALSEYRYGGYAHQGSMFAFLLRSGVGGAFVNRQGIYTSESKTLEPGHISINYGGPLCYCGARGCLQAYLMELDAASYEDEGKLLFNALEKKLARGNLSAEKTVRKAADYLFTAMKSVTRFLSPRSFLILSNGELISRRIADCINERWIREPDAFMPGGPLIFSSVCNPLIAQRGASDLVMANYFS